MFDSNIASQSHGGLSMIFSPTKAKDIRDKAAEVQTVVPLLTLVSCIYISHRFCFFLIHFLIVAINCNNILKANFEPPTWLDFCDTTVGKLYSLKFRMKLPAGAKKATIQGLINIDLFTFVFIFYMKSLKLFHLLCIWTYS